LHVRSLAREVLDRVLFSKNKLHDSL